MDRIPNSHTVRHITEAQGSCICILSALQFLLFSTNVDTVLARTVALAVSVWDLCCGATLSPHEFNLELKWLLK